MSFTTPSKRRVSGREPTRAKSAELELALADYVADLSRLGVPPTLAERGFTMAEAVEYSCALRPELARNFSDAAKEEKLEKEVGLVNPALQALIADAAAR